MTRIGCLFERLKREGRKGLIAYLTAGDPSPDRTPSLVEALAPGGPVIQSAGERALRAGTTLAAVLGENIPELDR